MHLYLRRGSGIRISHQRRHGARTAGQQICIGGPSSAVTAPNSSGKCNKGTLTTLASEQDLSSLKTRVSALESDNRTLK